MAAFTLAWSLAYIATWNARIWRGAAWLLPTLGLALLASFPNASPPYRLLAASALMLLLFKGAAYGVAREAPCGIGRLLFFTVWPGMDAESFVRRESPVKEAGPRFVRGLLSLYMGLTMILFVALGPFTPAVKGWLGIAALLTTSHFGVSNLLTATLQMLGFHAKPLFERPFASRSANDFWTRRWNLAFVEMNRRLFMPAITRRLGIRKAVVAAFLISGALHELALSYPAGAGWGGPMAYFAIQAVLVAIERQLPARARGPLWTWSVVLIPLPLLFHTPFRDTFVIPLMGSIQDLAKQHSIREVLSLGLWVAAGLHLLILGASFQVPSRLKWEEELPRLSSFNQKLMWTYGLFIVLCILAFSALTFAFHDRFLSRDPVAVGLAAFITIFWLLRVIVDCFYFSHRDWPEGPQFVAGHALLTSLFSFLVLVYGSVVLIPG